MARKNPTKRAARPIAKVSPLKGVAVETWMKTKLASWQVPVVHRLLAIANRAAARATVGIKWGQPVFEHHGPFAFIKPATAHVTFGFWRGAELNDPKRVLEGSGTRMKHLKIPATAVVDEVYLGRLVREAYTLNGKLGDPTKR